MTLKCNRDFQRLLAPLLTSIAPPGGGFSYHACSSMPALPFRPSWHRRDPLLGTLSEYLSQRDPPEWPQLNSHKILRAPDLTIRVTISFLRKTCNVPQITTNICWMLSVLQDPGQTQWGWLMVPSEPPHVRHPLYFGGGGLVRKLMF